MSEHMIIFNLPEEQEELKIAMDGWKYKSVLQDFSSFLRGELKYNEGLSDEVQKYAEQIKSQLHEIIESYGVSIWE